MRDFSGDPPLHPLSHPRCVPGTCPWPAPPYHPIASELCTFHKIEATSSGCFTLTCEFDPTHRKNLGLNASFLLQRAQQPSVSNEKNLEFTLESFHVCFFRRWSRCNFVFNVSIALTCHTYVLYTLFCILHCTSKIQTFCVCTKYCEHHLLKY